MANTPETEPHAGTSAVVPPDSGFETQERRAQTLMRVLPYTLLAISMIPYALTEGPSTAGVAVTLGLAALAAAWTAWMVTLHPGWAGRRGLMAVYYLGFLAVSAALIARSPWFAFFCWIGYLYAYRFLTGPWRYVSITCAAALSGIAQVGGFHTPVPSLIAAYVVVGSLNAGLVAAFIQMGHKTEEQNNARKRMIAELAGANQRLEQMMAENTGLHAQLLAQAREAGVLEERQRMAREIHDTLAQGLTGIVMQLEAMDQAGGHNERQRRLGNAKRLARDSLAEARRSVQALRPEALENTKLPEALAEVAGHWSAVNRVAADVTTTGTPLALHPEVDVTLLRVAQEALANVAKHASASRVGITLSYMDDIVTLDVRDDGIGFRPAGVPAGDRADGGQGVAGEHGGLPGGYGAGGFGLTGMRQRVTRLTGSLAIESEPGDGTAISASVPAIPRAGVFAARYPEPGTVAEPAATGPHGEAAARNGHSPELGTLNGASAPMLEAASE